VRLNKIVFFVCLLVLFACAKSQVEIYPARPSPGKPPVKTSPVESSDKTVPVQTGKKKIVLFAGKPSHGRGQHEHNAGVLLLKSCLDKNPAVSAVVHMNGWPSDPTALDNAAAIMMMASP